MKTYIADINRIAYHEYTDTLYIGLADGGLDVCETIEDIDSGISVMLINGIPAGAEIYDFRKHFGNLPVKIEIGTSSPFILDIPEMAI